MQLYGLIARNHSRTCNFVNLEKTSAEVVVRGFVAHLSVSLTYRNTTDQTLEVSYACPVDAKAAVYSFQAKLDGRTITAHCLEKKKAQEAYVNAVKQGHTAILGSEDEQSGDLLHLSLGNLPKGEVAELTLKIVTELTVDTSGAITFTLPTVFNPRYCPVDQTPGPEYVPSGSRSRAFTNTIDYALDVRGIVNGSFKIAKITSDSDPINVVIDDDETNASITQDGGSKRDHDWSFKIFYNSVHKANVLQMSGDRSSKGLMKDDVLMLNFFPEIPLQGFSPHNELIFVIDRSGSMGGSKIQKAKSTLLLFLKSLPPGCRFNIVSFGSDFTTLFKKKQFTSAFKKGVRSCSERYTEATLKKALELQKSMDADMGGTEIMAALKHVYSTDLVPGYARQMIVLTDGEVWNIKQICDLVSRHADETRVFSVGIGDGASTALVCGLAEAGRGRYEMVKHDSQLQTKVMGLVASMLQETVRDLKVECELDPPGDLSLVPKVPPVVFGGQHLVLYARIAPKTRVKAISISGVIGDNKISGTVTEDDMKVVHDSNFSFHRLAAKAQLSQWEMDDFENKQDAMVDLSVSSSVVCKATSFVGIDQDHKTIQEEEQIDSEESDSLSYSSNVFRRSSHICCDSPASSSVPQYFRPKKRSFSVRSILFGSGDQLKCATLNRPRSIDTSTSFCASNTEDRCKKSITHGSISLGSSRSRTYNHKQISVADNLSEEDTQIDDQLLRVVSSQKFDGSWSLQKALKFVSASEGKFKELQLQLRVDNYCFATILTLAYLEFKFGTRKQEWQLLQIKGVSFLQSKGISNTTEMIEKCLQKLKDIEA